ncbi:hypothetical protein [Sphingomonas sp. Ag1]|jgi:hypothetical protein|uniref:hypothetical protein n=1 Tax=Sphingomonas sp. Ag1 TaxID=1642949 RepID=UPI0012E083A2|nr:hypothetical protein [Sphingomonas sp. Ag1]
MDHYFAENISAPADLRELDEHIRREVASIRSSRISRVQRRDLLLQGAALPARALDLTISGSVPAMPPGARSFAAIATRLRHLIMPEGQGDARVAFVEALMIDNPEDTAARLMNLQQDCPEAVTALLELRIGDAYREMRNNPQWCQRPRECREIVTAMCHIRLAYWLRSIAMEGAASLHRPYGWAPLDTADADDAVRYGPVYKRFGRELDRVAAVVELYKSGQAVSIKKLLSWNGDREASARQWNNICLRAHVHEQEWRRVHGDDLENVLRTSIARATARYADMKARARWQRPTNKTGNMRVANLSGVAPQELLFHAARQVVAWTTVPKNIDELVTWVMTAPRFRERCPLPDFGRDQAENAARTYITLRFAFIDDDNMLPMSLRKFTRSDGSSVEMRSQADALRERGRRFTFDELMTALPDKPRLEVARKSETRTHQRVADLTPPMRMVLSRHLAWLQDGLT